MEGHCLSKSGKFVLVADRRSRIRRALQSALDLRKAGFCRAGLEDRMNARELEQVGQKLYGKWGWRRKLAATLDINVSTLRRWTAANHVPKIAALAIQSVAPEKK